MTTKKLQVPEYDGSLCTSSCGNDYDCPHGEVFDQEHGIVRSGLDFDIKHLPSDYPKFDSDTFPPHEIMEQIADQEAKWGEERVADNN